MRVLVTGASGAFGEAVIDHMAAAGREVVALSRRPPPALPSGVRHAAVDVRDADAVVRAMDGIDAVAHLAWATISYKAESDSHAVSVGGTRNVVEAMVRRGVPRLIFTSSATVYGPRPPGVRCREDDVLRPNPAHTYAVHKTEAEALVSAGDVECLIVRAANGLGRTCGGLSEEAYGAPVVPGLRGHAPRLQAVHMEDIGRFYAEAVEQAWTGRVNLAADDDLDFGDFVRILGRIHVRVPFGLLKAVANLSWKTNRTNLDPGAIGSMVSLPVMDTTRLREEFGFRCAWTTRQTAEDFALRLKGQFYLGKRQFHVPWSHVRPGVRLAEDRMPQLAPEPYPAAPEGVAGEFDTRVIPGFETFTAANTSEAFPGPLTPLTLEMAKTALDIAGYDMALMARVDEPIKSMLTHHQPSIFAHGIYANHTVIHALARTMPGYDPTVWDALAFGQAEQRPSDAAGEAKPSVRAKLRQSVSLLPRLASLGPEVTALDAEARRIAAAGPPLADLTDEALLARFNLLFDFTTFAWAMAASLTGSVMAVYSALEKQGGGDDFALRNRVGMDRLASAGAVREVERLAEVARGDAPLRALLMGRPPEVALKELPGVSPAFAAEFDAVLREYGHRGPRESELTAKVFGDAPERLVDAIAKTLALPPRSAEPAPELNVRQRLLGRMVNATQRTRERGRDVALRFEHLYRQSAREIGRRYTTRGITRNLDDVFYLVRQEIAVPLPDVQAIVERRRAERDRLAGLNLPITFTSTWWNEPTGGEGSTLGPGDELTGLGVSPGTATGPVRLMDEDAFADLQPGEILVTRLTDSGWTPLFAYAAAVVTEIGGVMSHAAVVARELGVPCVVMAEGATRRLHTGQLVEVDGTAGRIHVVGEENPWPRSQPA